LKQNQRRRDGRPHAEERLRAPLFPPPSPARWYAGDHFWSGNFDEQDNNNTIVPMIPRASVVDPLPLPIAGQPARTRVPADIERMTCMAVAGQRSTSAESPLVSALYWGLYAAWAPRELLARPPMVPLTKEMPHMPSLICVPGVIDRGVLVQTIVSLARSHLNS
jgi:hypothetical protein